MTVLPRVLAALGALALGLGGALVVAAPAAAATITVTDPGFTGPGTLEQAILDANAAPGSEISFALTGVGPWIIDIPDTNPLPSLIQPTTITGPGAASLTIHNADNTITGLSADGCSNPTITDLTISGLTIDGFDSDGFDAACIDLVASDLALTNNVGSGMNYTSAADNVVTLTSITASGNANGLSLSANTRSTITAADLQVATSTFDGVFLDASGAAQIDVGSSDSSDNGGYGVRINAIGVDTSVVLHDSSVARNIDFGVLMTVSNKAQVEVNRSTISSNDNGNIAGQLNDGVGVINSTTATDSALGGGIGFDVLGGSTLLITHSTASGNADGGGGVGVVASTVAVSGSTFDSNGPTEAGGGFLVSAEAASKITIDTSTFTNNTAGVGGGLEADLDTDSTLDITGSMLSDNQALPCGCAGDGVGGGLFIAGITGASSRFALTDSQVTGNESDGDGAGLYFSDLGANTTSGSLGETGGATVLRTTIDDNHSTNGGNGGGVYVDNWSWKTGTSGIVPAITFEKSTISNNSAVLGSALYADKYLDNNPDVGILLLSNSTLSGNDSASSGTIVFTPGFDDGSLQLSHTTVGGNTSGLVGGIFAVSGGAGEGEIVLDHAIIGDNGVNDLTLSGPDLVSTWSLVQNDVSAAVTGTGNITGVSPQLGPLANNGGSTKTMLVSPGSPAYNAGNPAFAGTGLFDQRGQARVYQVVDMGAVEWHPALALTGQTLTPGPPLVAFLLLFSGLAMVAFSRLRSAS